MQPAGVQQPTQETARLLELADREKRRDADRRIPGPGVAVIPVADAARMLGQRCGGGGDRRAGWRVGQQAQRQKAAHDRVAERQVRVDLTAPPLPPGFVLQQQLPRPLRADVDQWLFVGEREHRRQRMPRANGGGVRLPRRDVQPVIVPQGQGEGSPRAHQVRAAPADPRGPVFFPQPRIELDRGFGLGCGLLFLLTIWALRGMRKAETAG